MTVSSFAVIMSVYPSAIFAANTVSAIIVFVAEFGTPETLLGDARVRGRVVLCLHLVIGIAFGWIAGIVAVTRVIPACGQQRSGIHARNTCTCRDDAVILVVIQFLSTWTGTFALDAFVLYA